MNDANPVTDTLAKVVPPKYQGIFLFLVAMSPYITRGFHALKTGGGIKGAVAGIWFGTNTPKQPAPAPVTTPTP